MQKMLLTSCVLEGRQPHNIVCVRYETKAEANSKVKQCNFFHGWWPWVSILSRQSFGISEVTEFNSGKQTECSHVQRREIFPTSLGKRDKLPSWKLPSDSQGALVEGKAAWRESNFMCIGERHWMALNAGDIWAGRSPVASLVVGSCQNQWTLLEGRQRVISYGDVWVGREPVGNLVLISLPKSTSTIVVEVPSQSKHSWRTAPTSPGPHFFHSWWQRGRQRKEGAVDGQEGGRDQYWEEMAEGKQLEDEQEALGWEEWRKMARGGNQNLEESRDDISMHFSRVPLVYTMHIQWGFFFEK